MEHTINTTSLLQLEAEEDRWPSRGYDVPMGNLSVTPLA